jgi:hypothetical protein
MPERSEEEAVSGDYRILQVGEQSIRITLETGDALTTPGDVLIVKYAQASYGLDRVVLERLEATSSRVVADLPLPGQRLALRAPSVAAAPVVLFVGTPPLERLGYDAVRTWAREGIAALREVAADAETVVTTVHGVQVGGSAGSLDEQRSLIAQLAGYTDALEASQVQSLRWIRIVERDPDRAERLAGTLRMVQLRDTREKSRHSLDLSLSVQSLRNLGDRDLEVTASELALRLRPGHEDYAKGLFGTAPIEAERGPRHAIGYWLNRVSALYDEAEVARSKHQVLDGRLFLAGLATVDADLRVSLSDAGALTALQEEIEVKPREVLLREDVALRPDEPVTASADLLGRQLIARSLAEHLEAFDQQHRGRSFLVHVDGRWGAGKSTLLAFLVEEAKQRDWCVVDFDAWRQSRAGPPWLMLLTTLRAALRDSGQLRWWRALHERWQLLGRTNRIAAILLLLVIIASAVMLRAAGVLELSSLATTVLGALALITATWAAATSVGRFLALDSRRGARAFIDTRSDPMEDVARHFAWLRRSMSAPLLLLIDDLDRCDQEYVVELLDNTQKLVRGDREPDGGDLPTLFIVVAADGRWLRRAYELAHGRFSDAIGEPGRPLGSLFLDKLFQIHVPVPELSARRQLDYLDQLLGVTSQDDEASTTALEGQIKEAATNDEVLDVLAAAAPSQRVQVAELVRNRLATGTDGSPSEAEHALSRFAPLLEPNPRSMLRFVMAFSILRAARLAEGNPVPTNGLALWTIVSVRWPALAEFLQQNPERVDLFRATTDRLERQAPAELRQLLAEPTDEVRQVFNYPLGGPLTAAVIRECAGVA